jgi:uncharacterized protein (DUF169 family)
MYLPEMRHHRISPAGGTLLSGELPDLWNKNGPKVKEFKAPGDHIKIPLGALSTSRLTDAREEKEVQERKENVKMYDFEKPRGTNSNVEKAVKIEKHLRIPNLPVGIKFFKKGEKVPEGVGKEPDWAGTFCQFISQSRFERCAIRQNYIVRRKSVTCPFAPGVVGFEEWTGYIKTGEHMGGVHFETKEAAMRSQEGIPKNKPFSIDAILVGPLMDLPLEPDVVAFAIQPGMSNKVLDGTMWNTGEPYNITYYNMCGICGSGVAQAYNKKGLFIGFPCHGARRIGLFADTELFVAVNKDFFDEWILGMEKSFASGHSFPVGHMLRMNPPLPPHFKILEWPNKIMPLGEWEKQEEERKAEAKK